MKAARIARIVIPVLVLVIIAFLSCRLFFSSLPPVLAEHSLVPGTEQVVEWQANGEAQQVWIDVDIQGGRSLAGPVIVFCADRRIAQGTFSLAQGGIRESSWKHRRCWSSRPGGVAGQCHLFTLPQGVAGGPMKAVLKLTPGAGVTVKRLVLQVRSER